MKQSAYLIQNSKDGDIRFLRRKQSQSWISQDTYDGWTQFAFEAFTFSSLKYAQEVLKGFEMSDWRERLHNGADNETVTYSIVSAKMEISPIEQGAKP